MGSFPFKRPAQGDGKNISRPAPKAKPAGDAGIMNRPLLGRANHISDNSIKNNLIDNRLIDSGTNIVNSNSGINIMIIAA